jgi:hypothetical protein
LFQVWRTAESRKDFALKVQASGEWQTPFYALYSGKGSGCAHWLQNLAAEDKLTPSILDTLLPLLQEITK